MTLNFNPIPYRNDRPSASEYAEQWSEGLNNLGTTVARNRQQSRLDEQQALEEKIRRLQVQDEYGTEGLASVFGSPAPKPVSRLRSFFRSPERPGDEDINPDITPRVVGLPQEGPQLPDPMTPGAPNFDPVAYSQKYGSKRLKMFQDREDRQRLLQRQSQQDELDRRYRESEIRENEANANKSDRWTPNSEMSPALMFRMEEMQRKRQEADSRLNVPGFERDGSVMPKEEEAMKLREGVARLDKFERGINAMKEFVKEYGSYEGLGAESAQMKALATDLQLDAKELYNLGVLNGPDLMLITKQIADPGAFSSLFTRNNTRQAELDTVLNRMKQGVFSKLEASGYNAPKLDAPSPRTFNPTQGYADPDKEARYQQWKAQQAGPTNSGMLSQGNIDLKNRPAVRNNDGSISTVRTITVEMGGKTVLLPTVIDGRVVSPNEAVEHYRKTGENLGIFRDQKSADDYDRKMHDDMGWTGPQNSWGER